MRVAGVVVALGVLLVTACGGGEPEGAEESALTVAPSCTLGTVACTAEEAETQRLQAEFVEAYWTYLREEDRITAEGGVDEPTSILKQTTAEAFLEERMSSFRGWKSQGMKSSGQTRSWIRLAPGDAHESSDPRLTARICQDGRDTVTTLADGTQVREGRVVQATIFGKVLDGRPKIVYGDGEVVDKCE